MKYLSIFSVFEELNENPAKFLFQERSKSGYDVIITKELVLEENKPMFGVLKRFLLRVEDVYREEFSNEEKIQEKVDKTRIFKRKMKEAWGNNENFEKYMVGFLKEDLLKLFHKNEVDSCIVSSESFKEELEGIGININTEVFLPNIAKEDLDKLDINVLKNILNSNKNIKYIYTALVSNVLGEE